MPVLFGLLRSLQPSESDLPAIHQCKVEISDQIQKRWNLPDLTKSTHPTGSTPKNVNIPLISSFVDHCLKQCKFLGIQKQLELKVQLTDSELVSKEKQPQVRKSTESTPSTQSPSGTRPTALDILLGDEHKLYDSADDSDPVLNEIDSYRIDHLIGRHLYLNGGNQMNIVFP